MRRGPGLRWCVTTWDRLGKVAGLMKLTGQRFDVVVADEAHMVRHTTTQRWKHWRAVSGAARVKDAPFVLLATATPAHSPLELPYLAPHFAAVHGEPLKEWSDLPARLADVSVLVSDEGLSAEARDALSNSVGELIVAGPGDNLM